jgi:hypothetical protein
MSLPPDGPGRRHLAGGHPVRLVPALLHGRSLDGLDEGPHDPRPDQGRDRRDAVTRRRATRCRCPLHRTNTYSGRRKIVNSSTPTTPSGKVAKKWEQSDKRRWHVPCPHCEHYQVPDVEARPSGKGFTEPELARDAAHLVCESCSARIDEGQRVEMVRRGVWVPEGATVDEAGVVHDPNPAAASPGLPTCTTINSPLITLGELVERSLNEDEADFTRQMLAEPYDVKADGVDVGAIRERIRDDHKRGEVPKEATLLTAGDRRPGAQAWPVSTSCARGRRRARAGLSRPAARATGRASKRPCSRRSMARLRAPGPRWRSSTAATATGSTRSMTSAGTGGRARTPTKGRDRIERGKPFLVNQIDRAPNGRVLPGGLQLRTVNTLFFKDMLAQYVAGERAGLGTCTTTTTARSSSTSRHMLAERRVEKDGKVRWELKPGVRRNDWWGLRGARAGGVVLAGRCDWRAQPARRERLAVCDCWGGRRRRAPVGAARRRARPPLPAPATGSGGATDDDAAAMARSSGSAGSAHPRRAAAGDAAAAVRAADGPLLPGRVSAVRIDEAEDDRLARSAGRRPRALPHLPVVFADVRQRRDTSVKSAERTMNGEGMTRMPCSDHWDRGAPSVLSVAEHGLPGSGVDPNRRRWHDRLHRRA